MGRGSLDRGKLGSRRYVVVDAHVIPLVMLVSGTKQHDTMLFTKCLNALPGLSNATWNCSVTGALFRHSVRPALLAR